MTSKRFLSVTILGLALVWGTVPEVSAVTPPEIIHFEGTSGRPMESPGVYPRVYSGKIEFPHGRHFTEFGPTCVDCHHADSFEPDDDLETDVEITNCIECHDSVGLVYGRHVDELAEEDILVHRPNVIHKLCVGCHEEASAENHAIVAPIACRGCHSQRQADYTLTD